MQWTSPYYDYDQNSQTTNLISSSSWPTKTLLPLSACVPVCSISFFHPVMSNIQFRYLIDQILQVCESMNFLQFGISQTVSSSYFELYIYNEMSSQMEKSPQYLVHCEFLGSSTLARFLLLLLIILFQEMKLLLSGRNNSLGIFLYTYIAGLGSFFLHYALVLQDQILLEMSITISKDMLNPLALVIFLLASVCRLNGTWLGIWVDHKFIHYEVEDGIVDKSISFFITWSIRILATFLILHCSLDPLLAQELCYVE